MTTQLSTGHRLFAQYAHAPNALGYCGPAGSEALRAVACGGGVHVDVPALARRFSGAWPYQQVLADLAGVADPLDPAVVRGYWTGNALTDDVDRAEFGAALLRRIKPQAGQYWAHLGDDLLAEAAPTHAFHVLGVYPWSRLLGTGRPEPLQVLDSCRIGWATVLAVEERLLVRARHLRYDDGRLLLGEPEEAHVDYRVDGAAFLDAVDAGDEVALHWGFACDRLTAEESVSLQRWTGWQLEAMAPRLAAGT
ncbi:MAG TPA: DUF6390 family protein [Marmoricola sp.]|nr:DUF6390 family protein [Marmoricola sp.]